MILQPQKLHIAEEGNMPEYGEEYGNAYQNEGPDDSMQKFKDLMRLMANQRLEAMNFKPQAQVAAEHNQGYVPPSTPGISRPQNVMRLGTMARGGQEGILREKMTANQPRVDAYRRQSNLYDALLNML